MGRTTNNSCLLPNALRKRRHIPSQRHSNLGREHCVSCSESATEWSDTELPTTATLPPAKPAPDSPMSVVLIHCHDLGRHLGCYGAKVASPNLDTLAGQSIVMTDAHATAPLCSPSRGSLFTGLYPHRNGIIGLAHHGFEYASGVATLPHILRDNGYVTALFGMQHETLHPETLGFTWRDTSRTDCDWVAEKSAGWLTTQNERQTPFLLVAGFEEAHRPFVDRAASGDDPHPDVVTLPPDVPDSDVVRRDFADLHASIRRADRSVGKILSAVDDETWVVFFTDHGLAMPRMKSTLYSRGTEIALMIRPPRSSTIPRRYYRDMFSGVDLLPTLCDLLGLPIPTDIDGFSHAAHFLDHSGAPRSEVYMEKSFHDSYDPIRAVRSHDFAFIRHYRPGPRSHMSKDVARSVSGLACGDNSQREVQELYDLRVDPFETVNVADDPGYADVVATMSAKLSDWQVRTRDAVQEVDEGERLMRIIKQSRTGRGTSTP